MSRDLMRFHDALFHAQGLANGLGALVALMAACNDADGPTMHQVADLLGALHKDLDATLREAQEGLRRQIQ